MNNFGDVVKQIKEKKRNSFFTRLSGLLGGYFDKLGKNEYTVNVKNVEELTPKIDFSSLKIPQSFRIENPEEIAEYIIIPKGEKFPEKIEISNLSELSKYLEVREKIQIPSEFSIKNLKDIPSLEFPENLKKLSLGKSEKLLEQLIKKISLAKEKKVSDEVFIKNKKAEEYIPVRLVDRRGKDWLQSFGESLVSFPSKLGIKNIAGGDINPATAEKQDDIISAIEGINITVDAENINLNTDQLEAKLDTLNENDFSSEAKQDTLISLVEALQELNQRLAPLGGAMANTAQLRAVVTGAVTATGGGYVTSAQVVAALLTQTNSFRLESNNTLPTLANINNVSIT